MRAPHGFEGWFVRAKEFADQLFEEVAALAIAQARTVSTETGVGNRRRVIVEIAERNDVDDIGIGSHGREDRKPCLLGSVTEAVVFRSPVRVPLVR